MITKAFIKKLKDQIERSDTARVKIIRETHPMVREAKHAIFKIHRGEINEAEKSLEALEKKLKSIVKEAEKANSRNEGTLHAAVEEFLEALYLLKVIQEKPIPQKISFSITADEQLSALSDLTGELVRAATLEVTKGHLHCVQQYRDATEELFGVLMQMNLRGILRQKRDDARRNLKRLEDILYDVSLKS
jgi:translin